MLDFIEDISSWKGSVPTCLSLHMLELGFRNKRVSVEHIVTFLLKSKNEAGLFMAKISDLTNWFDN